MVPESPSRVLGLGLGAFVVCALAGSAWAHPGAPDEAAAGSAGSAALSPDDYIPAPPPTYQASGVTVDEHLGSRVPLDAAFRDQDGHRVTLGEVLHGELPTILTFNYSDCPMLCSVQLNGLTTALPTMAVPGPIEAPVNRPDLAKSDAVFALGSQFRIVTIDLEPSESLAKMVKMKERYVARLPEAQRAAARAGWTFLVAEIPGDGAAIRRVAEAVGFRYTYVKDRAEWAHPAALIFLSAAGAVTRYVYGIEFPASVMRSSIFKAGLSEPATAVGFMNRCYHFDPDANSHARAGVLALRLGAVGFLVLLLSAFGVMHLLKRHRRPGVIRP
jgi:protein SCO1/2